jgi:hypothetical protein
MASPRWRRGLVSGLLLFHLGAVVLAPFAFATTGPDGASPVVALLAPLFRGYSEFAYLNHGYAFFAPDPGPSVVLQARAEFDDGRSPVTRIYPDRRHDFPRLLYHRHFMLSEQLNMLFLPAAPPPDLADPEGRARWGEQRQRYERRRNSFVRHLRHELGADRLTLQRVQRRPPDIPEVLGGMSLDDPQLLRELPETVSPDEFDGL